jgi:UDP-N-acetylmuramyl-tripeptide synthetase
MMKLKELLKDIEVEKVKGLSDCFLSDLQYDSRMVEKDQAFIAIKGYEKDGHDFVLQAYQQGARVFFVENELNISDVTQVLVKSTRKLLPVISRKFFHYPDKKLKTIAITGTNGKTTTAYLIYAILKIAKWKPGLLTTVEYFDGSSWIPAERTTPESLDIFRSFRNMALSGLKSVVMEVSSHALSLNRVDGIQFMANLFTNLGRDHLDFHKTVEEYFLAKRKLFENLSENQRAILNLDEPYSQKIMDMTNGEIFTYSMKRADATVNYLEHQVEKIGMSISFRIPAGKITIRTPLVGEFNIYNILAAVATAVSLGLHEDHIVSGLENSPQIPGRCEYFASPVGYAIYVDYAHTPDALQNILRAIFETKPQKLIVVFGAGGDRDKGKRPLMGQAAENYADRIILTNDNPRSEDPSVIINDILAGIADKKKVLIIPDRRDAIHVALSMAEEKDAVIIAGKGHESYQEIAGNRYSLNDRLEIQSYFEKQDLAVDS